MTSPASAKTIDLNELPQFDGFPYLNTRLIPALYHITVLPADSPEATLHRLAHAQARANRLDTCLVLDAQRAVYFATDGTVTQSDATPRGGTLVSNRLALAVDLLHTRELRERQGRLNRIVATQIKGGSMFGDLSKGGRRATSAELAQLRGSGPDGTPRGLERCSGCGDWRGVCLDPSETFAGLVMTAHCRCENHNRCARCGLSLYNRRLNANYYDPEDRSIWHVPGFCGLNHACNAFGRATVL